MIRILIAFFLFSNIVYSQSLDSLLVVLEETISIRGQYDERKETRISNVKKLLEADNITPENRFFITNKLITEYEYYSFDESLKYINQNIALAREINNDTLLVESHLRLSRILATSGRYIESIEILNGIDRITISDRLFKEYFFNYKLCYSELKLTSRIEEIKTKYDILYTAYSDSLNIEMSKLDRNSIEYLMVLEQNYRDINDVKNALDVNSKILSAVRMGTRDYSFTAFNRSYMIWDHKRDKDSQKKHLTLSAISDIQGSVKDNASLTILAEKLFEDGEVEKAHKYINFSIEDARFYNSKLRFLNISNISPKISNSFETKIQKQSDKLERQLIFISLLSLVLAVALFFIFKQFNKIKIARRELKKANSQLEELNKDLTSVNNDLKVLYNQLAEVDKVKEQYIGTFLNLYSEYIDKLDIYRKMVRKQILTNNTNELLEFTKSKQVIESELKLFYTNFDKSFLHIYPNFIESVNGLLKAEEQIRLSKSEILNTELRILALIRLGIVNSTKISKILRYSVNTIYNYRVKLRNGAVNRIKFEDLVKRIS
ncbi:DUF6377 domain-containing protein [Seonamhaeicola maritimus]|uniref:DUF6377 domain-containing protein n=1 Tax=Seonamhaeicola maritimus TaxID=2591822 RepID=UPI00249586F8|nr:DUF6377 domain-containing protein [Seonamhaeicola maritimus]